MEVYLCVVAFLLGFGVFLKWARLIYHNLIPCEGAEANRAPQEMRGCAEEIPQCHIYVLGF